MKNLLFSILKFILGKIPLWCVRFLGCVLGIMVLFISKRTRCRTRDNLIRTHFATPKNASYRTLLVAMELGKTLMESICIAWIRPQQYSYRLIKRWGGIEHLLNIQQQNKPIIFLTPHIGNFEIFLKAAANIFNKNMTILYKPSKNNKFNTAMQNGRTQTNIIPVPISKHGIIKLIKALKNKEYIGILPDSVASAGDGVWVDFFNNTVFATTLAAKLILNHTDAEILIGINNRVFGGFEVDFIPYKKHTNNKEIIVQDVYNIIENAVKKNPYQYFWSYNRFRTPDHAKKQI